MCRLRHALSSFEGRQRCGQNTPKRPARPPFRSETASALRRVFEKEPVLRTRLFQAVTPLRVGRLNFWPRWRQKHLPIVTVRLTKRRQHGLACHELKMAAASIRPLSKNTQPSSAEAAARSTSAVEGRAQRRVRLWAGRGQIFTTAASCPISFAYRGRVVSFGHYRQVSSERRQRS